MSAKPLPKMEDRASRREAERPAEIARPLLLLRAEPPAARPPTVRADPPPERALLLFLCDIVQL